MVDRRVTYERKKECKTKLKNKRREKPRRGKKVKK